MSTQHERTAREVEADLLARCIFAAAVGRPAADRVEASVFLLASNLVRSRNLAAADQLLAAGDAYFLRNHGAPLTSAELLDRGVVTGLPRLRDSLLHKLDHALEMARSIESR